MMFKFPDGMHDDRNQPWAGSGAHSPKFWMIVGVFLAAGVLGADLIWSVLEEGITLLCEFVAEQLESFYRIRFGLDLYHAQMATAYTGALVLLIAALAGLHKFGKWVRHARKDGNIWWHAHHVQLQTFLARERDRLYTWWCGLDLLNKFAVLIGLLVMAVPFALLLSFGLGMVVAEIL